MNTKSLFLACLVAVGTGCFYTPTSALVCPTGDVGEGDESPVVSSSPPDSEGVAVHVDVDTEESNEGTGGNNKDKGMGNGGKRLRRNAADAVEDVGESGSGESSSGTEENSRRVAIKVHGQSGKFSM